MAKIPKGKIEALDRFFVGRPESRALYDEIAGVIMSLGDVTSRVSKSQIAFRRHRNFVLVWIPGRYLRGQTAPLVLTFSFPYRDKSPRWKEVVEAAPQRFTHHIELFGLGDIDDQVRLWLRFAFDAS